jgi:hypothetical protein
VLFNGIISRQVFLLVPEFDETAIDFIAINEYTVFMGSLKGHRKTVEAAELQSMVDRLYRGHKPKNVVEDLIKERRREAEKE